MKTARKPKALAGTLSALALAATAHASAFDYQTTVDGYYLASGHGVTTDSDGNAYVIGKAYADQVGLDILIIKLDADGEPVWTKFIVGDGHDWASGIVLDDEGNLYVTGWTDSDDFPVTADALDGTLTGFRDAFLLRLSTVDGSISYGTFLGGDYVDQAHGIVLNDTGDIYLVGSTESTDFPTTPDAYQSEPNAPLYIYSDVFITRLSPGGDSIVYSTYFGGYKDDRAEKVMLDKDGNIIIAGETTATDFPLVNPVMSQPNDIFIARLSADGSTLQFSTYFGGEEIDYLGGMDLDSDGYVYIAGTTESILLPTTAGAFQEDFAGEILGCGSPPFDPLHNCSDAFLTKLATDGSGIAYSTYLGGTSVEGARDVAVDSQGCAHVVGYTSSDDFPPEGIGSSAAIFAYKFNPAGSAIEMAVTIDSGSANAGHGIAVDDQSAIYFTGAINVPADLYVAKISVESPCPADVDNSSHVDIDDLFMVLSAWGTCDVCPEDVNLDGIVDIDDVFEILAAWGPCA